MFQLYESAAERRARLLRARARAQFSRDANEARGWLADKLAMLNAQHGMCIRMTLKNTNTPPLSSLVTPHQRLFFIVRHFFWVQIIFLTGFPTQKKC